MAMPNTHETTRVKHAQDPKMPFLIHRVDGRLMPNVAQLRKHPDYRPYTGAVKASLAERMLYLSTGSTRVRVVDTTEPQDEPEPFDVGKATADELVAFAATEFGVTLNASAPLRTLRRQVVEASKGGGPAKPDTDLS